MSNLRCFQTASIYSPPFLRKLIGFCVDSLLLESASLHLLIYLRLILAVTLLLIPMLRERLFAQSFPRRYHCQMTLKGLDLHSEILTPPCAAAFPVIKAHVQFRWIKSFEVPPLLVQKHKLGVAASVARRPCGSCYLRRR